MDDCSHPLQPKLLCFTGEAGLIKSSLCSKERKANQELQDIREESGISSELHMTAQNSK